MKKLVPFIVALVALASINVAQADNTPTSMKKINATTAVVGYSVYLFDSTGGNDFEAKDYTVKCLLDKAFASQNKWVMCYQSDLDTFFVWNLAKDDGFRMATQADVSKARDYFMPHVSHMMAD